MRQFLDGLAITVLSTVIVVISVIPVEGWSAVQTATIISVCLLWLHRYNL